MEAHGVPGWLLPAVIFVEAGCGLGVLLGFFNRWSSILLAGFRILAALFFHNDFADKMHMINFMKNITTAGGFLVLVGAGPGALALDNRRIQPSALSPRLTMAFWASGSGAATIVTAGWLA